MAKDKETAEEELARLEDELEELKKTLPEHCYGTKGYMENGRAGGDGLLFIESEISKADGAQPIACSLSDPDAPPEAAAGGHGTSEYYLIRDFLDAVENDTAPPFDVVRSMDFTVPGIVAHESAISDGNWREVPRFDA